MLIALGANKSSKFNSTIEELRHGASAILACDKLNITKVSGLYSTSAVGGTGRQPRYLNAVIEVNCSIAPAQMLRLLKRIELNAGRRQRGLNAPRPLDLDIVDFGGRRIGWDKRTGSAGKRRRRIGGLILAHPELHKRRFVLEPLLEIAPHWVHPVLGKSGRQLVNRLPRVPGSVIRLLDSEWLPCDTVTRRSTTTAAVQR